MLYGTEVQFSRKDRTVLRASAGALLAFKPLERVSFSKDRNTGKETIEYNYFVQGLISGNLRSIELLYIDNEIDSPAWKKLVSRRKDFINESLLSSVNYAQSLRKNCLSKKEDSGMRYKLLYRSCRILTQNIQLLTEGGLSFPLPNAERLKDLRENQDFDGLVTLNSELLEELQDLYSKKQFFNKPDLKWLEDHVQEVYALAAYRFYKDKYGEVDV